MNMPIRNKNKGLYAFSLLLAAVFMLALGVSCAKKQTVAPEQLSTQGATEKSPSSAVNEKGAAASPAISSEESVKRSVSQENSELKMVHFDFDKYNIKKEYFKVLDKDAKILMESAGVPVIVEGNCDERGSAEYNLALGERRAKSVKDYLVRLGVSKDRINTISYGKEKPLDPGHDEKAHAMNRRVEIKLNLAS